MNVNKRDVSLFFYAILLIVGDTMKKLLFLLLLLVPFMVHAEVKITSVNLIDNTKGIEADTNPSYKDLTIDFNLKFSRLNDYAKYKVLIKNDTKKDYEIEDGESFSKEKYIKYNISISGSNEIIKAGEEKELLLTITYNKEVPENEFINNVYTEKDNLTINLSNNDKEVNPKTSTGIIIAIAIIAIISLLLVLYNHYKLYHFTLPLLLLLLIPVTIIALEKITIKINTKIEITIPENYFAFEIPMCGNNTSTMIDNIKYREGMTIEEFLNSDYLNLLPPEKGIPLTRFMNEKKDELIIVDQDYARCINEVEKEYHDNMTQEEKELYNEHKMECLKYKKHDGIVNTKSKIISQDILYYSFIFDC